MQIGIDATSLPPQPVGAGNYIIQLVRALAAMETEHQFVIFAERKGRELIGEISPKHSHWIILPDFRPSARLVWEQIRLPILVKHAGIEVLHSLHYTRPLFLPCKSVVTFHDMTFFLFPELHTLTKRIFFPAAIRYSARYADGLIAVSESTRSDTIRILRVPPEKIFTIPSGISDIFHPIEDTLLLEKERLRLKLPGKFILYVGLIEPRKNIPLLVQAYADALRHTDLPALVLVGRKGWMCEQVFNLVAELDLSRNVHFTGYIPLQDLPFVYNLANFFVYPSTYEGFGFPPLEAMACGTPVIAAASSAMLENIGESGLLVPPLDRVALSQALISMSKDKLLHDQLAKKGRIRAAEFTWQRTATETSKVYLKV